MAEVEKPLSPQIRAKIQVLISSNTITSGGDFHVDTVDEDGLIYELEKNFKLIPRDKDADVEETLDLVFKKSTKKVRGMIEAKALKQSLFLKRLHENFELEER